MQLNYWKSGWTLDPDQCPCDIHFVEYLRQASVRGSTIFHMGTGLHHHVGCATAALGADNHVLAITASREEYEAYIDLLIATPALGFFYQAYFGDIYQIDGRLLPLLDYASFFHCGEYRSQDNDLYGALTDEAVAFILADRLRPGGEMLFFAGSFAYDVAQRVAHSLITQLGFIDRGRFETLHILKKPERAAAATQHG